VGRTRRTARRYQATQITQETIGNLIPITVEQTGTTIMIISKGGYAPEDEPNDDTDTGWILPAVNTCEELEQDFVNNIKNQRGKVVSDGSYKK